MVGRAYYQFARRGQNRLPLSPGSDAMEREVLAVDKKAAHYMKRAADQGHVGASYYYGVLCDSKSHLVWAAQRGHVAACKHLIADMENRIAVGLRAMRSSVYVAPHVMEGFYREQRGYVDLLAAAEEADRPGRRSRPATAVHDTPLVTEIAPSASVTLSLATQVMTPASPTLIASPPTEGVALGLAWPLQKDNISRNAALF